MMNLQMHLVPMNGSIIRRLKVTLMMILVTLTGHFQIWQQPITFNWNKSSCKASRLCDNVNCSQLSPMYRYYQVMFTSYNFQEVSTVTSSDQKGSVNQHFFYSRVLDSGPETCYFTKYAFNYEYFPVNFQSHWSFE